MPFASSATARQGTRKGTRRFTRRRASVKTRIKYQPPSARNQKSQLATLAKLAVRNAKLLNSQKVYTDWFQSQTVLPTDSVWNAVALNQYPLWQPGNRKDDLVADSQSVFLRNMMLEWTFQSFKKDSPIEIDIFVVTVRPSATTWTPTATPTGSLATTDFTDMGFNNAPHLNSGIFKVHYAKHMRLFPVNSIGTASELEYSGNPFTTYRRGKINIKLNYKVRSPTGISWKELNIDTMPARQRLYMLYRCQSTDSTNALRFTWGSHSVAITQT